MGRDQLPEGLLAMARKALPQTWRYSDRPRRALTYLLARAFDLAWVVVLFLLCELLIWGIYAALRVAGIQFLSSIVGMVAVFLSMLLLAWLFPSTQRLYNEHVRSKVSFRDPPILDFVTVR